MRIFKPCSNNVGMGWVSEEDESNITPFDCEESVNHSLSDTIQTNNARVIEAFKYMLPPEYCKYVKFDSNGVLRKDTLLKAKSDSTLPKSKIFDALCFCINSNFNLGLYVTSTWQGRLISDSVVRNYAFIVSEMSYEGITVMPGDIPTLEGIPVTGNPQQGWIFIRKGLETSNSRLAFIIAHELLGHMYRFLVGLPAAHSNPDFASWIYDIEEEADKNWKKIRKLKKTNTLCF